MLTELLAALSALALLALWTWMTYHLVILLLGWPHSKVLLRTPFHLDSLRNPVDLPSVSVIVAAKDEENVIEPLLNDVIALHYPRSRLQVVIAEDGSRDRTRELCEAFAREHAGVVFLHGDVSNGKAAALNRAVRHATGEVLLFLDADTKFGPDLLLEAAKFFHDQPAVDAAQAIIETHAERPNLVAKLDAYETVAWYRGILAGKDRLGLFVPLCGTGMFIKRFALARAGDWAVDSLAEDIDMAVRLSADGAKVRVLPSRVWRQPPYSIRDFANQRMRWWGGALQALPKGARLWRNPNMSGRAKADMILQLASPLVFVLGTLYLLLAAFLNPIRESQPGLVAATLLGIAASQFLLVGMIVAHSVARRSARNLNLIPGIYLYWVMQLYAVVGISIRLAFRRPPRWKVTTKRMMTGVGRPSRNPAWSAPAHAVTGPLPNGIGSAKVTLELVPPDSGSRDADHGPRQAARAPLGGKESPSPDEVDT